MPLDLGPPDLKLQWQRFHEQFGESMDPRTALNVLQKSHDPNESDFWLCFCLVYPDTLYDIFRLKTEFEKLDTAGARRWFDSLLSNCIGGWGWYFRYFQYTDWEGRAYNWNSQGNSVVLAVSYIVQRWETLRPNLQEVSPSIPAIDKMIVQMNELVQFLRVETKLCQSQAEAAERIWEESR